MWTRIGAVLVILAAALLWWGGRDEHARAARDREGLAEVPPRRATSTASEPDAAAEERRDDPPERGPCTLRLRVVDQATGRPVVSRVHLWQLDAPATEHWMRGDRRVHDVAVGLDGATVEGLPEGLYRVACEAQLRTDESPPAFVVRGEETEVELPVRLPRKFVVCLRVVDERGRPVADYGPASCTVRWAGDEGPPAWVVPRRGIRSHEPREDEQETGFEIERNLPALRQCGLFDLGEMHQDSGSVRRSWDYVLGFPRGSRVMVSVDGTIEADRTYLGVTVPIGRILECVRLPGGGDPKGISLDAFCHAVEETGADWRDLRVDVTARLRGYEPLEFRYRVAGPNEVRVMRPK